MTRHSPHHMRDVVPQRVSCRIRFELNSFSGRGARFTASWSVITSQIPSHATTINSSSASIVVIAAPLHFEPDLCAEELFHRFHTIEVGQFPEDVLVDRGSQDLGSWDLLSSKSTSPPPASLYSPYRGSSQPLLARRGCCLALCWKSGIHSRMHRDWYDLACINIDVPSFVAPQFACHGWN